MPRGRKKGPANFEEEIQLLDMQIADLTKKLKSVREKKKLCIKNEKEKKDVDKWELVKNSGYSVDDILNMIKNKGLNSTIT